MEKPAIIFLAAAIPHMAGAEEISLGDCPAPVKATILNSAREGRIAEVEKYSISNRTLYVAEVRLSDRKELTLHVRSDGSILKQSEDVGIADLPAAVRSTAETKSKGGEIEDVEKITSNNTVFYRVEIEREEAPDVILEISLSGGILREIVENDH